MLQTHTQNKQTGQQTETKLFFIFDHFGFPSKIIQIPDVCQGMSCG
jgi:hypothetical protein